MTEFGSAVWPPSSSIETERLVLREAEARDHAVFMDLLGSSEVQAHLGGPPSREQLDALPEIPGKELGIAVVALDGAMIGQVILRDPIVRRAAGRWGTGKVELGYLFLPQAWGFGYAAEACEAALDWLDTALPGEPVVLFTQTANARSLRLAAKLGFTEVERFHYWGAEQWFGLRSPVSPPD